MFALADTCALGRRETDFEKKWDRTPLGQITLKTDDEEASLSKLPLACFRFCLRTNMFRSLMYFKEKNVEDRGEARPLWA